MYLHFLFLHFLYDLSFLLMKFLNTSAWRKIHSIKLSDNGLQKVFLNGRQKVFLNGHQKVFLSIYWINIYVWTLAYEVEYACGFEFLRTFLRIFVMYEFSAAVFIKVLSYQSFDVKWLLLSRNACV